MVLCCDVVLSADGKELDDRVTAWGEVHEQHEEFSENLAM